MDNEDVAMNYILNSAASRREENDRIDSDGTADGNHRVIDHSQRQFPHFRPRVIHAPPSHHRYDHHPSRTSEQRPPPFEDAQRSSLVNSSMDISAVQSEGDARDQTALQDMDFDSGLTSSPFPFNVESFWSLMPFDEGQSVNEPNSIAANVGDDNNNSSNNNNRATQPPTLTTTTTTTQRQQQQPLSSAAVAAVVTTSSETAPGGSGDENWEDRRNASLLRGIGRRRRFAERNGGMPSMSPNNVDEDDHLRSRRRMSHRMMTIREHRNNQADIASTASTGATGATRQVAASLLDNPFLYFQHPTMLSDNSRRPSPPHSIDGNRNNIPRMLVFRRDPSLVDTDDPSSQRRRNEYFLPVFSGHETGLPGWRFSTMPTGSTAAGSNSVQSQVRIALQQHSILNAQLVSVCPKILEGCRVACNKTCFIDEMAHHEILKNCKALGAEVYPSYCAQITHFISPFQAGEEYERACSDSKIIVSLQWLDDCISAKSYIEPYKPVVHYPLRSWTGIPEMKGLVISVTGFVGEERSDLKFLIRSTGATYSGALQRKENTHLLCSMPEGEKYKKALEWKIKVVNARWIFDCVAQWAHLPEVLYQDIFVNR